MTAAADRYLRGTQDVSARPSSSVRHAALTHPLMCIQGPPSANVTFPSHATSRGTGNFSKVNPWALMCARLIRRRRRLADVDERTKTRAAA